MHDTSQGGETLLLLPDGTRQPVPPTGLTIGRQPGANDLVISDATASRSHADLRYRDGTLYLNDHSANGTVVNGVLYRGRECALADGDTLEIGDTRLTVHVQQPMVSISMQVVAEQPLPSLGQSLILQSIAEQGEEAPPVTPGSAPVAPLLTEMAFEPERQAVDSPPQNNGVRMADDAPGASVIEIAPTPTEPAGPLTFVASAPAAGPNGAAVDVKLRGVLDVETADLFREQTQRLIEDGAIHFTLALDELEYLDSSGLGALVALHRAVKPRGGSVTLTNLQPTVKGVIELTRLDRVFAVA
jgi:anti-sigma B factor antagonist